MSRHLLEARNAHHEVSIGWDPPLANFFLQVQDLHTDEAIEDPVFVWLGADGYATESNVDRVLAEAELWALVPCELRATLLAEQAAEGVRPHRVLQGVGCRFC